MHAHVGVPTQLAGIFAQLGGGSEGQPAQPGMQPPVSPIGQMPGPRGFWQYSVARSQVVSPQAKRAGSSTVDPLVAQSEKDHAPAARSAIADRRGSDGGRRMPPS